VSSPQIPALAACPAGVLRNRGRLPPAGSVVCVAGACYIADQAICAVYRRLPRTVTVNFKSNGDAPADSSSPVAPGPKASKANAVMKAVDGNEATANIAYSLNDVSFIYPITPATPMGEWVDQWSNEGRKNLHGNVMQVWGKEVV